ncbi:hypothetical protein BDN72DRAFT_894773 [Pluteus cervinus]|uniref:Uncharacterized protein n=1 Tax=Pluteus cervinus TaxID=181527 RepID=A0ACD3B427_9AGAR|nr:hypothetical protein BDN72DRAFT_894773 [Pluteus cervinus]
MPIQANVQGGEVQPASASELAASGEAKKDTYCFTGLSMITLTGDYMDQYKREVASHDAEEDDQEEASTEEALKQDTPKGSGIQAADGPSPADLHRDAVQEIISGMVALLNLNCPPKSSPPPNLSIHNPSPPTFNPSPHLDTSGSKPKSCISVAGSAGGHDFELGSLDPRALATRLEGLNTRSGQQTPQSGQTPAETPAETSSARGSHRSNNKKRMRGLTPPTDGLHWDSKPVAKKMKVEELEEGEIEESKELELEKNEENPSKPQKKRKRKKRSHRGSGKSGEQTKMTRTELMFMKHELRTEAISSSKFILVQDARVGGTGWMGAKMDPKQRERIANAWRDHKIEAYLKEFKPVQADLRKTVVFVDGQEVPFLARTDQPTWIANESGPELVQLSLDILVDSIRVQPKHQKKGSKKQIPPRGPHEPIIIGHDRPYDCKPSLSKYHRERLERLQAYIDSIPMKDICKWLRGVLERLFPGTLKRYDRNAAWHFERYGIKRLFDPFWNFCFNACYSGQDRVHCRPHTDHKNIVGVCVVIPYLLPDSKFDYKRRSWLVIWEAGVIIEMPPWTAAIYPSSLFFHFNIDIQDIEFIETYGDSLPERKASEPGDEKGRGSMVFFNQASMFQSSELDFDTVAAAKLAGHNGATDFPADVQAAFQKYSQFVGIPKPFVA